MAPARSWLVDAALLVTLPFGAGHGTPPPAGSPGPELVTGTVGEHGEPRVVPAHDPPAPAPAPDLERGVVP
ncbi:hypothetical protein ACFPK1_28285 [Actinomycetospora rhizophila]|uniref:Uncharacterized protein n=1 Tax=Actinomycetospora rhizophila TaxID=1416876 RepID=A0ABV9ZKZ0_9PSEU